MRTKITIAMVIVFIIGTLAIVIAKFHTSDPQSSDVSPAVGGTSAGSETTNPSAGTTSSSTSSGSIPSTAKTYSLAQVGLHGDASSCWTEINGKVYDVTSWINQHPGGPEAILSICGKDGSAAFNDQHGGQRRPAQELASFYIGDLVK